jgi:hypothetical protein
VVQLLRLPISAFCFSNFSFPLVQASTFCTLHSIAEGKPDEVLERREILEAYVGSRTGAKREVRGAKQRFGGYYWRGQHNARGG